VTTPGNTQTPTCTWEKKKKGKQKKTKEKTTDRIKQWKKEKSFYFCRLFPYEASSRQRE